MDNDIHVLLKIFC